MDDMLEGRRFVHGLRTDDDHWTDLWNFSLAGTRSSVGVVNQSMGQVAPDVVPLDVLRALPSTWPPMAMSGFLSTVWQGAIVRNGLRLGRGVPPYPTRWASEAAAARILKNADRELALEAARRRVAPRAPSRLSCIWLAEDLVPSRNWVRSMLGRDCFLLAVRVVFCQRMVRCDARWLDRICKDHDYQESAEAYWSGTPVDDDPLWEFVLNGMIGSANEDELERLRAFVRDNGPPQDLLGPPAING